MPPPRLIVLAQRVRDDLETHFTEKPRQRRDALANLLKTLVTAEAPEPLEALAARKRVRGLRTHLDALVEYLRNEAKLPEALCCHYQYNQSEIRVRAEWGISPTEWAYVHHLAREVDRPLDVLYLEHDFTQCGWHDRLEEEIVFADVIFDQRALNDMLVCALEAYLSPKPGRRKAYEVYGVNLGMRRERADVRKGRGRKITQYVSVVRSQPQISAESTTRSVTPSEKSNRAFLEAARALFPQYETIGEFHSHPYDDLPSLVEDRGWEFSNSDLRVLADWFQGMKTLGERPVVSLAVAIARCRQHVERSHYRGMEHTLQMSVGDCRVIIGGARILESGHCTRKNIRLRVAGMIR